MRFNFSFVLIFIVLGISIDFRGSEDKEINPRIYNAEEVRKKLAELIFAQQGPDSDLEEIHKQISEIDDITYDLNEKYKTVEQVMAEVESESEDSDGELERAEEELKQVRITEENESYDENNNQESLIIMDISKYKNNFPNISSFLNSKFLKPINYEIPQPTEIKKK